MPTWAWPVVRAALATVAGFLACSALVVVVAFALDARLGRHRGLPAGSAHQ